MQIKQEFFLLLLVLGATAIVIAILGRAGELFLPTAVLYWGLVILSLTGFAAVGFLRIKNLQSHDLQTATFNGHQYLLLQMSGHLTLIDSTRITDAITTLSPATADPPKVSRGESDNFAPSELETLVAALPAVERFSDDNFKNEYLG